MTNLRENIFAVEVPEGAEGFKIDCIPAADLYEIECYKLGEYDEPIIMKDIDLPPGAWQIICATKDATYTQAAQIVEAQAGGFKDYNTDNFHHDLPLMNPFDSLRSLLEAKRLRGKNYVILKKV